jgi:hypothetical protein
MAIIAANDISISIGQWLPFDEHFFGYYFVAIGVILVFSTTQSAEEYFEWISRRIKFNSFEELKLTSNILINHYVGMEMSDRKKINYLGILKYHLNTCTDPSCFCKKKSIYDVVKNKFIDINSW